MRDGIDEAALRSLTGDDTPDEDLARLAELLNAVSAPASATELAGEEAAVTAFREAREEYAGKTARRRWGGATALGVAVAALLGVGAAVASGGVPVPFASGDDAVKPAPTKSAPRTSPAETPSAGSGSFGDARSSSPTAPDTLPSDAAAETTSPVQLAALCRSYAGRPAAQRDEALDSPAFQPLIAAAGDDRTVVDAFCAPHLESPEPTNAATTPTPDDVGTTPPGKTRQPDRAAKATEATEPAARDRARP